MISFFPNLVSYNRFVELQKSAIIPLTYFLKTRFGYNTGIAFIDDTQIVVCHNKRINSFKSSITCPNEVKARWDGFMASNYIL